MVTRDGRVKILDFGLAKPLQGTIAGLQTRTDISHAACSSARSATCRPNRSAAHRPTRDRTCLRLASCSTNWPPDSAFNRQTTVETLNAILKEDRRIPESLPPRLRQIVQHCLEKEPSQRFQSAHDVAFALRSFASTTTTTRAQAGATQTSRSFHAPAFAWVMAALSPGGERVAYLRIPPGAEDPTTVISDQSAELVVKSDNGASPAVLTRITECLQDVFWSRKMTVCITCVVMICSQ